MPTKQLLEASLYSS